MTDFFDNNALSSAVTSPLVPFLLVPYIDADSKQLVYPFSFPLESQRGRSPWLQLSPADGKILSSLEYEWFRWMFILAIWGDRFGRDAGLQEVSGSASEGTIEISIVSTVVA